MQVGTILFFVVIGLAIFMVAFHLTRGAGPNWMWRLGRYDPMRNIFFRPDGSWRRYGKLGALLAFVIMGLIVFAGF
jgi:hypothetical protein